uniref:Tetraspanin n=1 Tax=Ciona savignyi TaxID=51511 RepID=H2Y678_CIOSA
MCGGFGCSKNALAFLNVVFLLVGVLLIAVATYAKAAAHITSFEICGGIIASGLFLFLIALLGLIATTKHHQVLLFFYIVILFLLFIIQFSVSIACLALSEMQVATILGNVWAKAKPNIKVDAQSYFDCCGWTLEDQSQQEYCQKVKLCNMNTTTPISVTSTPNCTLCSVVIPQTVSKGLEATGGIGLFFSFIEMLGVWLAVRFRNQKDPAANPSQFL